MPDIWTKHPDVVRDLLKEAGFRCGVPPRFLPGRDPAWTCALDGKQLKGDLYIHHVSAYRGEGDGPARAALGESSGLALPVLLLVVAVLLARWRRTGTPLP